MNGELVTLHVPFLTTEEYAAWVQSSVGALPGVYDVCCDMIQRTVAVRCAGTAVADRALLVAVYRVAPAACGLEPVTIEGRVPVTVDAPGAPSPA